MSKNKLLPDKVKYLALEGGGFKGIAYVGAIEALEQLGILDLPSDASFPEELEMIDPKARNKKILGFAGTSIGAFVSFLLTLGYDSKSILEVFTPGRSGGESIVDRVFEKKAEKDVFRCIRNNVFSAVRSSDVREPAFLHKSSQQIANQERLTARLPLSLLADNTAFMAAIGLGPLVLNSLKTQAVKKAMNTVTNTVANAVAGPFGILREPFNGGRDVSGFVKDNLTSYAEEAGVLLLINGLLRKLLISKTRSFLVGNKADKKFIDIITGEKTFDDFFYNIIFDCGAFTGLGLRKFLHEILKNYLDKGYQRNLKELVDIDPGYKHFQDQLALHKSLQEDEKIWEMITKRVTFDHLHQLTGKELSVVGANLKKQSPFYFDVHHTPHFPVIDAVSISMNFPFLFKPVIIEDETWEQTGTPDINGYWTDGGLVNNTPIHAFDKEGDANANENVLCLRLTPGAPPLAAIDDRLGMLAERFTKFIDGINKKEKVDASFTLFDFLGDFVSSAAEMPAEAGQLRTEQEKAQSLELYSFSIQLLDLQPYPEVMDLVTKWSRYMVFKYFNKFPNAGELLASLQDQTDKLLRKQ